MHFDHMQPNYTQHPNHDNEMIEQPQQTFYPKELCSEPRLIRKNNIFADMM